MHLAVPAAPAAYAVALVVAMLVRARGAVLAVGVFAVVFRVLAVPPHETGAGAVAREVLVPIRARGPVLALWLLLVRVHDAIVDALGAVPARPARVAVALVVRVHVRAAVVVL